MIRIMKREDLDQVIKIENRCFPDGWSRATFEKSLESEACRFFLEEEGGRVCGYAGIYLAPGEAELFTIACDPDCQRRKTASRLMEEVFRIMQSCGAKKIFLEVRSSNEAAKKLYEKFGFQTIGIRKDYYSDPTEDALLMERSVPSR